MNIELRFLQKAIEDRNYICFMFEMKKYIKVKALKLEFLNDKYSLNTDYGKFEFDKLSKIQVLKDRF